MIKFFRKIRQNLVMENKTGKYFKYAIGEIILVVIGILIALQINNWNENKKQLKAEKIVLNNIHKDLATDSIQFQYYLSQYQQIEALHLELYRIGINNEEFDMTTEPTLIRRSLYFKQLIGKDFTDRAYEIQNQSVREALILYARNMADLENVYWLEVLPLIAEKVKPYLGEKEIYNAKNWFELKKRTFEDYGFEEVNGKNLVDSETLITLSKTKEFQQILFELNVKWNDFYSRLITVIKSNKDLRHLIKKELKDY